METIKHLNQPHPPSLITKKQSFLAFICAFDPHRLHIIGHGEVGEGADHKVSSAWSSCAIAAFLYLLIAGGITIFEFSTSAPTNVAGRKEYFFHLMNLQDSTHRLPRRKRTEVRCRICITPRNNFSCVTSEKIALYPSTLKKNQKSLK